MKPGTPLSEADLYHHPDPLYRLIGEPNESEVFVDGEKVTALIDSGAPISSIMSSLAKTLNLEIKNVKAILDLEATQGLQVPYLGYIEMYLKFPEVRAFARDILMLVVPDSPYCERIPVALGTLPHRHVHQTGYLEGSRKKLVAVGKGAW